MLILKDFIGKGATRNCFLHPENPDKCVKVLINPKKTKLLQRELNTYRFLRERMQKFIAEYDPEPAVTDKGLGLVCELLKNDDGSLCKPIWKFVRNGRLDPTLDGQIYDFTQTLLKNKLYFYDFNLNNFVVQINNGVKKLKYIDLKSYNSNKSWTFLKLEKVFSPLAEMIMVRRLKRFYKYCGLNFVKQD